MPEFKDLPDDFCCPYRHGCPYLEGLSTSWVFHRYQHVAGTECQYEYQLEELNRLLQEERQERKKVQLENQQLKAQLHALHRRQFKGRRASAAQPDCPSARRKKRGAPVGHPPWQRAKPKHIDRVLEVPAPKSCPHCRSTQLQPLTETHEHVQEDIILQPRTVAICYLHQQAYCGHCDRNVVQPGPGELLGSYIGPAAKSTAIYLRYELNVPCRKISRFFGDFFGLTFVPASAYGFERQATRRGRPLYEDLRDKIRALAVAHGDETSWRHDGQPIWVWYAGNDDLGYFHFDRHRTTQVAQSILGEKFEGVLVADALASYNGVHPKDWQSCLAHIKTKAKELGQELSLLKGKAADFAASEFCQKVQGFVRTACQAHHQLSRGPWRAKAAHKKGRALCRQLQRLCKNSFRYKRAEAFRKRLLGPEQKHFFTCFHRPNVPPTNNQAERSLRPVVIMRKVIQGTRSDKGLENHSVLRSLFETARRQGKKPHQFFRILFTKNTAPAQAALYAKPANTKPPHPLRC
jgi:hypothetical protein